MIRIRFPDAGSERQALGFLLGRFSFKSWANGATLVPDSALPALRARAFLSLWKVRPPMSKSLRRYEILLPLRFNDQEPIPDALLGETVIELRQHFGAVSSETQIIRGLWQHEGHSYRDDLVRVFVDVSDTPENRQFFEEYKERLKARFRQLDIWMTTYLIEVL